MIEKLKILILLMSLMGEAPKVGYFVLRYRYVADVASRRVQHRPAHLQLAQKAVEKGLLVLGGALEPLEEQRTGLLVFRCEREEVERFVGEDPYVVNGVVESYRIDGWNVVVGTAAARVGHHQ